MGDNNNKTILNGADANWIHGHYNGRTGVIAYELDDPNVSSEPVVHPPEPASITLIGSIDTPSRIEIHKNWGQAPILFDPATTTAWDGLNPDKDWSIVLKTDARVKFVARWGSTWGDARISITDNYGWNAGAPGHFQIYWKSVISIAVMGIPGDESARANINSMSFAVSYDSALYQSDQTNFTSITTGPQNENAAIKIYLKIGDGEWQHPEISSVHHYGSPVDNPPNSPSYFKGPFTSNGYYEHAYAGAGQVDEAELYNGVWVPPASSTPLEAVSESNDWMVTCGTNAIASDGTQSILVNGDNITPVLEQSSAYGSDGNISVNINNGNSSDFSDFAIKELVVWPRALTADEMKSVSDYMIANS